MIKGDRAWSRNTHTPKARGRGGPVAVFVMAGKAGTGPELHTWGRVGPSRPSLWPQSATGRGAAPSGAAERYGGTFRALYLISSFILGA
ncbi:hypothetical protein GCM10027073_71530 [Streptomyces chlorus]